MKFCVKCCAQISDTAAFCTVCGSPQPQLAQAPQPGYSGQPMQPQFPQQPVHQPMQPQYPQQGYAPQYPRQPYQQQQYAQTQPAYTPQPHAQQQPVYSQPLPTEQPQDPSQADCALPSMQHPVNRLVWEALNAKGAIDYANSNENMLVFIMNDRAYGYHFDATINENIFTVLSICLDIEDSDYMATVTFPIAMTNAFNSISRMEIANSGDEDNPILQAIATFRLPIDVLKNYTTMEDYSSLIDMAVNDINRCIDFFDKELDEAIENALD